MHFCPDFPHLLSNLVKSDMRDLHIMLLSICRFCEGKMSKTLAIKNGHTIKLQKHRTFIAQHIKLVRWIQNFLF
jgi:hypothetical protein